MIRDGICLFAFIPSSRSSAAERRSYKPVVAGSIPAGGTEISPRVRGAWDALAPVYLA